MSGFKLAVDTGGTFTDFCLMGDDGELWVFKEPSTPEDPSKAVLAGIAKIIREKRIRPGQISLFLHGTTVATNAILERRGARTALITTRGFKDVIFIGRQNRPHLYNFQAVRPEPLVSRDLVFEVNERILADGSVKKGLQDGEIDAVVEKVRAARAASVAICLLHSYINPFHELLLKNALEKRLPPLFLSVSSEILPEFREYERTSTTVINAAVGPLIGGYVGRLERDLSSAGVKRNLYIMQSNGGLITSAQAREQSARTVLSGPAGGVLAGVRLAEMTGYKNLITADMGGTSMDVCLIYEGEPRFTTEGTISGHPLRLPMLDIHTIGAGGGSVAWVDTGGALKVGPKSAGAVPGPACYGQGGQEPTVTDANLVLGRLSPEGFAGGRLLQPELAARCIGEKIARPLGLTLENAAEGIIKVVNANMVRAVRMVSVQRGYDPRDFTLVAFGGAGPLHAVELARELGIPRVLIPGYPGVTSAWGMLSADVRRDYLLTYIAELAPGVHVEINNRFDQMVRQGEEDLERGGFAREEMRFARHLDVRYKGQSYELTLPAPDEYFDQSGIENIIECFRDLHRQYYGYRRDNATVEVVALRLVAIGKLPETKPQSGVKGQAKTVAGRRRIYLSGEYLDVPAYTRGQMGTGWELEGPALISQDDSTILIWPGDRLHLDRWGNIIVETVVP
ncbi:MAG: hydantoinase/oxoprolinase family protein [Firmicutes bacterium]|nr:hydantoinase/oxoprolinase family protein [Bacillota bacterium]